MTRKSTLVEQDLGEREKEKNRHRGCPCFEKPWRPTLKGDKENRLGRAGLWLAVVVDGGRLRRSSARAWTRGSLTISALNLNYPPPGSSSSKGLAWFRVLCTVVETGNAHERIFIPGRTGPNKTL